MNKIENTFKYLKENNKVAFIPFIVGGYPDIKKTEELVYTLEDEGANIIEIGIPYSDPLADGPVIERISQKSIEKGTTLNKIFDCVSKVRNTTNIPIVFLVYFNTILSFGVSNFVQKCVESEVDGLIIPDLPLEERDELVPYLENTDLCLIPLVTPTSNQRIKNIVKNSKGFVYCVSSLGVTGVRTDFHKDTTSFINQVRKYTELPLAIGFGISEPNDIKKFQPLVDGVIIGSAIVKKIEDSNCDFLKIRSFLKELCYPIL